MRPKETLLMTSWRSWIAWPRSGIRTKTQSDASRSLPASDSGGWSLRLRLLAIVIGLLLPLVVLIIVQGLDRARREVADTREHLAQTARAAATPEQNILGAGEQILRALANMSDVRNATPACNKELTDALHGLSFFTNITRLDKNGTVICAAVPAALGISASSQPIWQEARAGSAFVVSGEILSRSTHQRVIAGMLPLRDGHGHFFGALAIGVDVRWLDYVVRANKLPDGSVVALFDRHGHIITSSRPLIAKALFARPEMFVIDANGSAKDARGDSWTYATAPVVGDNVFVGFAMREWSLLAPTYVNVGADFIIPLILILFTWAAVWIVSERQLTRWIVYLRRISEAYRGGHYMIRPVLDGAPSEFRLLGEALADMAGSIQERDRNLREAIAQKTMLVREVHHRVKNNLQIVMSLLSLQAGRLKDPAAQEALRQARARINALALVHRILYEIEDQNLVDIKRLVEDLAIQTHEGFGGDRSDIRIQVDAVQRKASGDVAVPLALFTVEALTNAFKHAFPPGRGGGTVSVSLQPAGDGQLRLAVEDDGVGFSQDELETSIGTQLIRTFGQQLHGKSAVRAVKGKGAVSEIIFPDPLNAEGDASTSSVVS
jgi:two-component sensor histidine kinase